MEPERFCERADLLIHDAEYTPEEYERTVQWGHSVYTDALNLAATAGAETLGLYHLNQDREDDAVDSMVSDSRNLVTKNRWQLKVLAVGSDTTFEI